MIGLLLALVVLAIVVSLFGGWIFGIVIGAVAIILFIVSSPGSAAGGPPRRSLSVRPRCYIDSRGAAIAAGTFSP